MNKQELIDRLKKILTTPSEIEGSDYDYGHNYGIERAILLAKHLDEQQPQMNKPEKPVVPQYVADFYESIKDDFEYGVYELCVNFYNCDLSGKIKHWFDCNDTNPIQVLVNMHQFGYEVEKEKFYTVELPNPNGGTHLVLCKDCDGKLFIETFLIDDWESFGKCKLTEAEIKKEFSWTWQFAKECEDEGQEEKLYTVEFPNPNSDNHLLLRKNFDGKVCVSLLHSEYWRGNESTRLTEAEIKEGFAWAWQFAKEVEND